MQRDIVTDGHPGPYVATAWGCLDANDPGEPTMLANAELIVRAVNAHGDLLAALKALVETHDLLVGWLGRLDPPAIRTAREAIKKAEGHA